MKYLGRCQSDLLSCNLFYVLGYILPPVVWCLRWYRFLLLELYFFYFLCTGLHITTCCVVFLVGKILLVGVVICFVYCLAYYKLLYDFWGGVSLTCFELQFVWISCLTCYYLLCGVWDGVSLTCWSCNWFYVLLSILQPIVWCLGWGKSLLLKL